METTHGGARRPLKGFNIAVNERDSGASSSFVSFMHMSGEYCSDVIFVCFCLDCVTANLNGIGVLYYFINRRDTMKKNNIIKH